jgi:predicted nucleotidyltransferase
MTVVGRNESFASESRSILFTLKRRAWDAWNSMERRHKERKHMKTLGRIKKLIADNRTVLAERFGVRVVGIFGSCVRGEQKKGSDIDVLAEIERPISLLELVGAEIYLGKILGRKVDMVPKEDIREELRETILKEVVSI